MLANDLKKGDVVRITGTGWRATIEDNKKGVTRMARVEGIATETGSIYIHDIAYMEHPDGPEPIEYTRAQAKQIAAIKRMGF